MGQKVNPIGFRLAVNKDWRSRWFAGKKDFARMLIEDLEIHDHVKGKLKQQQIDSKIWRDTCLNYFQNFSRLPVKNSTE